MESDMLNKFNSVVIGRNLELQREMNEIEAGYKKDGLNMEKVDGVFGVVESRLTEDQEKDLRERSGRFGMDSYQ